MLCKKSCDNIKLAGRAKKIKFKLKTSSEFGFHAEAVMINQDKDKKYVGFVRFDRKFCSRELLMAIGGGDVDVNVYDKTNENYYREAAEFVQGSKEQEAAVVQFRRGSGCFLFLSRGRQYISY